MSETAYVLRAGALPTSETATFPGFPGQWREGEPLTLTDLGFDSERDADARVKELGLPLEKTTGTPSVDTVIGPTSADTASSADADVIHRGAKAVVEPAGEEDPRAGLLRLKRDDLNARAAEAGVDDPEGFQNKEQLADAILAAAGGES